MSLWRLGDETFEEEVRGPATLPAARLFVLSFVALILVGTLGLLFLPGLYTGPRLGIVDALFMATSAVCVTGLVVVDTATYFTPLGQLWIALLIQAGGLGILTFTTFIALAVGGRAALTVEEASGLRSHHLSHLRFRSLVRSVLLLTFALEGAGALLLWISWRGDLGSGGALWPAVFHAVSAFSNAGFSVFSDSLTGMRTSPLTLVVIMALVVSGGIGFLVLADLRGRFLQRSSHALSLHTRLVLAVTGILLVGGWVAFTALEWGHELATLPWPHRLLNGAFMAVTPRTAGFNTVDYGAVDNPTLFLTFLLMFVGGSPGSTAGGVKTVTAALLFLVLLARIRGDTHVSVFNRSIPRETVSRAAGLVVGAVAILALGILLLLVTEVPVGGPENRLEFVQLVFEAGSAFGTVGLSMGVTPQLTTAGRLVVVALMFVGRVGPLALVSAMSIASRRPRPSFRYGEEDVIIG